MKKILPVIISVLVFVVGLATMNDYGMNWDSPEHFMRGNAILQYYLTLGKTSFPVSSPTSPILITSGGLLSRYSPSASETGDNKPDITGRPLLRKEYEDVVNQTGKRFSFYQNKHFDMQYFLHEKTIGHLPLGDIFFALGNVVFFQKLGLIGDLTAYQIFGLLIGALGVYLVIRFTLDLTGSMLAGCIAGIVLALHPSFFSHVHLNLKDPIVAVMYVGTIWSLWHWVRDKSIKWGIRTWTFFIFGIGVKWTIGFLPLVVLLWLVSVRGTPQFHRWFAPKQLLVFTGFTGLVGIAILFAVSPFLWHDAASQLASLFSFYRELGVSMKPIQPDHFFIFGFNSFPWLLLLTATPEVILLFSVIAFLAFRKSKDIFVRKTGILMAFWVLIPLLRLSLPGFRFYGGTNQFMEVLPALAILAGVGFHCIVEKIPRRVFWLSWVGGVVLVGILVIPIARLYPNENLYFNSLVGGIAGASERKLYDWFTNYGNLYKQAADWINKNTEKEANIAHLDGPSFALTPLMLRTDISISPYHFSGFDTRGEYIVQVPDILGSHTFSALYPQKFLRPIYEIKVQGVTVLIIYKNDPEYRTIKMVEEKIETPPGAPSENVNGPYWEIDLGRQVNTTRIVLSDIPAKCQKTNTRFVDETIGFFDDGSAVNKNRVYTLQEHRLLAPDLLEYDFAGEPGRFIRIYIGSGMSCFLGARIAWVNYLP